MKNTPRTKSDVPRSGIDSHRRKNQSFVIPQVRATRNEPVFIPLDHAQPFYRFGADDDALLRLRLLKKKRMHTMRTLLCLRKSLARVGSSSDQLCVTLHRGRHLCGYVGQ